MQKRNKVNKNCLVHMKKCDLICTFSKCQQKIICEKCEQQHQQIHPKQFIYHIEHLSEIHSYDKVDKMKELLGANKIMNQQKIKRLYVNFNKLLDPLLKKLAHFQQQSRKMVTQQLSMYLLKNKAVIERTKINSSQTKNIKDNPKKLVEETIHAAEIINERENLLKQNTQKYNWYSDATEQLCLSAQQEIRSMVAVANKILDNYLKIQASRFTQMQIGTQDHHEKSFYARYANSHKIAGKGQMNNLEMAIIQSRKQVQSKDTQIRRANNEIKEKVKKIEELSSKMDGLKQELIQWQKKLEREQKQKREAKGRQRKKNEEYLIKIGIINDNNRTINLEKKNIEDKYISLIFEIIPEPIKLQLTQHSLTKAQLANFLKCKSVQILKMSFMPHDFQFIKEALTSYRDLHTLQLNSAGINDEVLGQLANFFPPKLKNLHLIDNQITDDGVGLMFKNMQHLALESLFLSYNNLTARAVQVIRNYAYDIKVLHLSKNQIKSKGVILIGKYLKQIQQLYIGGTGVQKEGLLAICRNCPNLKRLNIVATELSTDIVSEILLGLPKLQWLDISYSNLNQKDLEKIQKLKIFNKNLEIIANL